MSALSTSPPLSNSAKTNALHQVEDELSLDQKHLQKILDQFLYEFNEGLSKIATKEDGNLNTFLPMIPTFVHDVPNGTEKGDFLALDLGGTNLRVCSVTLDGNKDFKLISQKYRVSEALKTGTAEALFDYIADSVLTFLKEQAPSHISKHSSSDNVRSSRLYLGFTFSFPVHQTALNSGKLLSWTKGFEATGAVGKDVAKLLQDALDRKKINVYVSALVNDTVGTMLSRAYACGSANVGAIFGTGVNAAYLENIDNVKTLKAVQRQHQVSSMIVNTEIGAFDNERHVLKVTAYDNKLDRESINPRRQAFEKMVSGMYLGEVVRNVLLALIDRNVLFNGHSSTQLNTHYGLDSALLSKIESKQLSQNTTEQDLSHVKEVLIHELGVAQENISFDDLVIVSRVSEMVGTRSARLSAVALAAIYTQTKPKDVFSVGVDGSLVEFYPRFEERIRTALKELVGDAEKKFDLGLAKDGSGVGAALCALEAFKDDNLGTKTVEKDS